MRWRCTRRRRFVVGRKLAPEARQPKLVPAFSASSATVGGVGLSPWQPLPPSPRRRGLTKERGHPSLPRPRVPGERKGKGKAEPRNEVEPTTVEVRKTTVAPLSLSLLCPYLLSLSSLPRLPFCDWTCNAAENFRCRLVDCSFLPFVIVPFLFPTFVLGALFLSACAAAAAASTHQCRLPHSLCVEPLSANFCNFAFDDDDEVVGMDGNAVAAKRCFFLFFFVLVCFPFFPFWLLGLLF